MRAREFLKEFTINVPVTINLPLGDLLAGDKGAEIINPGVRYGEDGDAKWSPPLQQHLDTVKDSVGPSETDPSTINPEDHFHEPQLDIPREVAQPAGTPGILGIRPSMPG